MCVTTTQGDKQSHSRRPVTCERAPVQRLRDSCANVLSAVTQQAEAANRPLRSAVLRHLAELGAPPDPAADAEALTWWAARLLCVQTHEKLQARHYVLLP